MLPRCISKFSSTRIRGHVFTQNRYFSSAKKDFSGPPKPNAPPIVPKPNAAPTPPPPPPGLPQKPPESGSHTGKIIIGGVLIGAAVTAAYKTGYLDLNQESGSKVDAVHQVADNVRGLGQEVVVSNNQDLNNNVEKDVPTQSYLPHESDKLESESHVEGESNVAPFVQHKDLPSLSDGIVASDDQRNGFGKPSEDVVEKKESGNGFVASNTEPNEAVIVAPTSQETETKIVLSDGEMKASAAPHATPQEISEASKINDAKPIESLLDEYFLPERSGGSNGASFNLEEADGSKEKKDLVPMSADLENAYMSKDGKLVFDFLQAIHAAEERQAELDAQILIEEKKILKEKFEKELKDARARELMYAEEVAILDKELSRERTKAAATVKLLQEKAEENLKKELERKDYEAELQLKKAEELAKAEIAAAIACEKASQIEKMAEANLNINALCLAFYARSEEARQNHSVHKLALGSVALGDALSKGLPIQTGINELHAYLEGSDRYSLVNLVFSSLPEEVLSNGADTQLELNQKFDDLKGTLRHFSFIPRGGGGMLTHALAHIASWLKVREDDASGIGIESIITRVERSLAEGNLVEAADALEGGVKGTQAEDIIRDWVRRARNRAVAEQVLSLLQSYAISVSAT